MRTRVTRRASCCLLAAAFGLLAARELNAQSQFAPYYGKNLIHYDTFDWHIYKTDHFEIYYYTETEQHLERIASYAESAYQQVSSNLKHDLAFRVPLILFKTHSEFEQQNVAPGLAQEGVAAFAEGDRRRMLMPIDEPTDQLYGLIVHELTHVFQYDIIPTSLVRRNIPLWVNEGGADYERAAWEPVDLMFVRDAAVADIVPKMSEVEGYVPGANVRLIYDLGHAIFEFIESRWGKEGVRQFMFALRKSAIGGGADAYREAFELSAAEFDQQFDKYLKDRFKPFRDKERPADYGQDLSPNPERSSFVSALSIEPSPSGDLIALVTVNRSDQELDIILISSKDGGIVRNLTSGFDKDRGFEYISSSSKYVTVPWMSWSPVGDRLAYFVRTEKSKTLILQNVLNGRIEQRVEMPSVDNPESPNFSPDGQRVVFAGLRNAVGDIFSVDLNTGAITNLTNDGFADFGPVHSPDGKFIVYLARVSGNEKLFRLDLDTGRKTQLTFGTQDEASAKFIDPDTLVFPSTATDPATPVPPEVLRNGNIMNIWTLSLKSGELKQYTDALGGIFSPIVLSRSGQAPRLAFVDYYKGQWSLHTFDLKEPLHTAASADFGAPGAIVDFQAPLQHTIVAENKVKKGKFEGLFLDGRPPVAVGVTSGGDVMGGSQVTFSDVLGDQLFALYAASVQQYRTLAFSYLNLSKRFQYSLQGYSQTQFFYGYLGGSLYADALTPFLRRSDALATQTVRGGSIFGIYPFNRYRRIEFSAGLIQFQEQYNDPGLQQYADQFQQDQYGTTLFRNGLSLPLGALFVQETTVFREFGPLSGSTMRLSYEVSPKVARTLSRQTLDGDARYYARIGSTGLAAFRIRGFKSWGEAPDFLFFGGNSEMRGYEYREFLGHNGFYANAELRFPLIEAMLTPLGVLGGIRGVMFANLGAANINGAPFKFWTSKSETFTPITGYDFRGVPQIGRPQRVGGFRLIDGRASYGIGLETFALGFPIHFDWSRRTLFNRAWEDLLFGAGGGSGRFRKTVFDVWIGYDF